MTSSRSAAGSTTLARPGFRDPQVTAVGTLITELMSMRCTVTASGHERLEAWREGNHDDLVFAVALA